jgi:hypothetical protein
MLYALLQLLADGRIGGNALLNYTYELVELTSEQSMSVLSLQQASLLTKCHSWRSRRVA